MGSCIHKREKIPLKIVFRKKKIPQHLYETSPSGTYLEITPLNNSQYHVYYHVPD